MPSAHSRETAISSTEGWEWDVYYTTHDMMRHGVTEAARSRVMVLADSYHESWCLACWMIICRSGFYVTRTEFLGPVDLL